MTAEQETTSPGSLWKGRWREDGWVVFKKMLDAGLGGRTMEKMFWRQPQRAWGWGEGDGPVGWILL